MKAEEFVKKNPELLREAKICKTLEEFETLAKENNIEFEDITLDEAFSFLNNHDEINDDLLDTVAGGKKKDKLERVPNKYEAAAFELTGHDVYKQYGENFVKR